VFLQRLVFKDKSSEMLFSITQFDITDKHEKSPKFQRVFYKKPVNVEPLTV